VFRAELNVQRLELEEDLRRMDEGRCDFYFDPNDRPLRDIRPAPTPDELDALSREIDALSELVTEPAAQAKFERTIAGPFRTFRRFGTFDLGR
jgi:hypothetical protein